MKLLMISTDAKLLEAGSEVSERMKWYATVLDELQILLITKKTAALDRLKLNDKVTIYPRRYGPAFRWRPAVPVDLVTAQDPFENGLLGWRLARKLAVPLELQIHTDLFNPYFIGESLKNRLRVIIARWLLPRADCVRVVSERVKDSLKSKGIDRKSEPVVLPVFIDLEKLKQAPIKTDLHQKYPQFTKIILIASRLTREKNISLAIAALKQVVENNSQIGLVIVGSGAEEQILKKQVSDTSLAKSVIFESWSDDLASYYKTADLFLNTSRYEGYGRTIIEALACGCPVVSTDVGVAKEAGVVIVAPVARELAQAMITTISRQRQAILPEKFRVTKEAYLGAYSQSFL